MDERERKHLAHRLAYVAAREAVACETMVREAARDPNAKESDLALGRMVDGIAFKLGEEIKGMQWTRLAAVRDAAISRRSGSLYEAFARVGAGLSINFSNDAPEVSIELRTLGNVSVCTLRLAGWTWHGFGDSAVEATFRAAEAAVCALGAVFRENAKVLYEATNEARLDADAAVQKELGER